MSNPNNAEIPKLEDFVAYVKAPSSNAQLKSSGTILIFSLITAVIAYLISRVLASGFCLGFLLLLILNFTLFKFIVTHGRRRARRYVTDSRSKIMLDKRSPILYLRPFSSDDESELVRSDQTLEELFVKVLDEFRPVIAVGNPNDDLPALGAIKLYFDATEWQGKVKTLMSISQLVIVQAGVTDALEWELRTAILQTDPKKLVISFLNWQNIDPRKRETKYELFRMLVERVFRRTHHLFPKELGGSDFIQFDDDWAPYLSKSTEGGKLERNIRSALVPIFHRL